MADTRFHDDTARRRYQLLTGDDEVGFIEYDLIGDTSILIKHTEVRPGHEGQGLGSQLLEQALAHIRQQGRTVVPICPYALAYIRRHPQHHALVHEDLRRTL
jgi:hypothetical protein